MEKLVSALVLSFLLSVPGSAQSRIESTWCLRFAVVERTRPGSENGGIWPEDAAQWWQKEGKRKFPELCETTREDAYLVLAWTREQITEEYSVQVTSGGFDPYARPGMVCNTDTGALSCHLEQESGSVTWETRERKLDRVSVAISQVTIEPGKFVPLASITKQKLLGLKPGKAAFQNAMKALRKEARKSGIGNPRP